MRGPGQVKEDGSYTSVLLVFEGMPGYFIMNLQIISEQRKGGKGGGNM